MEKLLLAYVATTLGVAEDEVMELLKDSEDANPILELHKVKVKERFDDGYKKAERKVKTDFEKEIKEKFGLKSDKQGIELVSEVLEVNNKETSSEQDQEENRNKQISLKDLPEELVKKTRWYLDKEKEVSLVKEQTDKEWQAKWSAKEAEDAKKETFKTVVDRALPLFKGLDPLLPLDAKKAENQVRELLINKLEGYDYEIIKDDRGKVVDILVLNADGSKKTDDYGNTFGFDKLVKQVTDENFETKVAQDRSSPGITTSTSTTGQKQYNGPQPRTLEERNKLLTDKSLTIEQRNEIQKEWEEKHTSNV